MIKIILGILAISLTTLVFAHSVLGQTTTPTSSPTPTTVVPSGAPATGFGQ